MEFQSLALSDLAFPFIMNHFALHQILSASTEDTDSISTSTLNLSKVPHCTQHLDCSKYATAFIDKSISTLAQKIHFFLLYLFKIKSKITFISVLI